MSESAEITITIEGLKNLDKLDNPAFKKKLLKVLASQYNTFLDEQFLKNANGGGAWAPLKKPRERDKIAAKKNNEPVKSTILIDTGQLHMALTANMPGHMEEYNVSDETASVSVGIGGSAPHIDDKGKGHLTIAELAFIHHFGVPKHNLPARPIIVPPNNQTEQQMSASIQKMVQKEIGE